MRRLILRLVLNNQTGVVSYCGAIVLSAVANVLLNAAFILLGAFSVGGMAIG